MNIRSRKANSNILHCISPGWVVHAFYCAQVSKLVLLCSHHSKLHIATPFKMLFLLFCSFYFYILFREEEKYIRKSHVSVFKSIEKNEIIVFIRDASERICCWTLYSLPLCGSWWSILWFVCVVHSIQAEHNNKDQRKKTKNTYVFVYVRVRWALEWVCAYRCVNICCRKS